jgi:hypothetical protein
VGYTTEFNGHFEITPTLTGKQRDYINLLSKTRRMKRDVKKLEEKYHGRHGNPFVKGELSKDIYGIDGEFFAIDDGRYGQTHDDTIIDYNVPPGQIDFEESRKMEFMDRWIENERRIRELEAQPSLWLKWEVSEDGSELRWNQAEKFYYYKEWLEYLIDRFFNKWEVVLNGRIRYIGEDRGDRGSIIIEDNIVTRRIGDYGGIKKISEFDPYGEEDWGDEEYLF